MGSKYAMVERRKHEKNQQIRKQWKEFVEEKFRIHKCTTKISGEIAVHSIVLFPSIKYMCFLLFVINFFIAHLYLLLWKGKYVYYGNIACICLNWKEQSEKNAIAKE